MNPQIERINSLPLRAWWRAMSPPEIDENGGSTQPIAFQYPDGSLSRWDLQCMWESLANIPLRFKRSEWPSFLDYLTASDQSTIIHGRFALEFTDPRIDCYDDDFYSITIARPHVKPTKTFRGSYTRRTKAQLAAFDYLVRYCLITELPEVPA